MSKMFLLALFIILMPNLTCAQINDDTKKEIGNMNWKAAKNIELSNSNSEITYVVDFAAITGNDALRYQQIAGNTTNGVEAELLNPKTGAEAVFQYVQTNYVNSDDWNDVNAEEFLHQISDNTEKDNIVRQSEGIPGLHVDGWLQVPTFNESTHTVSWILSNHDDSGDRSLNAVALKLGRRGIERITYIDSADHSSVAAQNLLLIADKHQFNSGSRYTDYVAGTDKAAGYGVGGLVAGLLGVKLVKVAAAGGILLLLKKAGILLILPFLWIKKKLFGYKKSSSIKSTAVIQIEDKQNVTFGSDSTINS